MKKWGGSAQLPFKIYYKVTVIKAGFGLRLNKLINEKIFTISSTQYMDTGLMVAEQWGKDCLFNKWCLIHCTYMGVGELILESYL